MKKLLNGLVAALVVSPLAALAQSAAPAAAEEPKYPIIAVLFFLVFIGLCVGFVFMLIRADKKGTANKEVLETKTVK